MTSIRILLCGLAAAICLFLFAPAWSQGEAQPPLPEVTASVLAEAQALMQQGRFDEVVTMLQPLVGGDVVHADTLFLYGLAALNASEMPNRPEEQREALLDEAIGVFLEMLVNRPELVRVRLELARAFFLKGEDRLATRHFEQVLAGEAARGGGAECCPVSCPDPGTQALEHAPRLRDCAGQQYRFGHGRADHQHHRPAV